MDTNKINDLAKILRQNQLTKLDLTEGDTRIVLEAGGRQAVVEMPVVSVENIAEVPVAEVPSVEKAEAPAGVEQKSPLVGTVYLARKGGKLMNQEEIKKILPHRDHMLLIDEAELREGKAYGKKTIRGDEFFLQGHFPGNPVVPGVILCEILGQSACVLLSGEAEGITPFFTGLDKVRFKNPVHPGDVFETECTLLKHKGPFYWAEGKGYVDGKLCVSAEFSFALIKE